MKMSRIWFSRQKNVTIMTLVILSMVFCTFWSQIIILPQFLFNPGLKMITNDDVDMNELIFFIETSRRLTPFGEIMLNPRQACAIESAAKNHPNRKVFLLYLVPDDYQSQIYLNASDKTHLQLLKYDNIKICRIELDRYLRNSPLDSWHGFRTSKYLIEHTSDMLRTLTLWKYGGTYFDLDFVIMRNIDEIGTDFVVAENDDTLASVPLSFKKDGIGHKFLESCLTEIRKTFRGDIWNHNGPQLISRVMKQYCTTNFIDEMSRNTCQGINVLEPNTFNPIPWFKWKWYFNPAKTSDVIETLKSSFGIHLWNKMSHGFILNDTVRVAYNVIAEQHCPYVYQVNKNNF